MVSGRSPPRFQRAEARGGGCQPDAIRDGRGRYRGDDSRSGRRSWYDWICSMFYRRSYRARARELRRPPTGALAAAIWSSPGARDKGWSTGGAARAGSTW